MNTQLAAMLEDIGVDTLEVLDCHGHLGPSPQLRIPRYDAASIVRSMDLLGIQTTFVSALAGMVDEDAGDAGIRRASSEFPGRLAPVPIANPNHSDVAVRYLDQWAADGTANMIKVHPDNHSYSVLGPGYRPIFELAAHRWLVLSHTWGGSAFCDPRALGDVAGEFPDTVFIAGHSGGTVAGCESAVDVAIAHPNVYLDLTGSLVYDGMLEWMVQRVGADRILFGTDVAFLDPRPQFGRVVMARITRDAKRSILGDNLRGLLEGSNQTSVRADRGGHSRTAGPASTEVGHDDPHQ